MKSLAGVALATTIAAAAASGQSGSAGDSIVAACMERDTSTAWRRISMSWTMERPGSWSNDSLRRVLIAMAAEDQAVRPVGVEDSVNSPAFVRRLERQDSLNLVRLRDIVRRFGWPTKSMVGAQGASAAFVIAQHNAAIQEEALQLMLALPAGEVQASELAMLEDRIHAQSGRLQKYATQLKPPSATEIEFYPIDSISRVEARRAAVGLPPMNMYLCMMRGFTGRAPKYPP